MQVTPVSTPCSSKPTSEESPSTNIEATDAIEVNKDCEESDADIRKVPEILAQASTSATGTGAHNARSHGSSRKRSAAPQEKETKRMKRLLRNRVSAQQARERKKAYVTDLETRMKEIEQRNAELEEKISTLQRENFMLRQIVKNTTMKSNDAPSGVPDLEV